MKQAADKEKRDRDKEKLKAQKDKERRDKAALENAKKEAEQQEESKRLEGRMLIFLQKAAENQTHRDFSFAGINLGGPKTQIVARVVAFNTSLTSLHMSRKNIQDKEGMDLAKVLINNKTLRKLELEGNCLGMQTARMFAMALRKNTTLRFLDLESNNLTNDTEESGGVDDMVNALAENKTLISLNLANNRLTDDIGRNLVDLFNPRGKNQDTLIDFEFGNNPFRLEDVRKIQDFLRRNKAKYDEERLQEWRERKTMGEEDSKLLKYYLERENAFEQARMEEEAISFRTREIDKMFKAMMLEEGEEKKRVIQQLLESAEIRGSKGKKKKRGGKKGKKKK